MSSKVWYCPNCGYEVHSRGRCHACRDKLIASDLPELEPGDEDDEVGYRLGGWAERDRGRLIEYLNVLRIPHRFEDEELVVVTEDEQRVDELIAELVTSVAESGRPSAGGQRLPGGTEGWGELDGDEAESEEVEGGGDDEMSRPAPTVQSLTAVRLLSDAARRLRSDPTDMQADADVAEASAGVFMADELYGVDADDWAAVGRVTRRLLAALGAEEAMEEEIRLQASVLSKLLESVPGSANEMPPAAGEPAKAVLAVGTVYELPEWTPEQRAHLSVLLDDRDIPHEWEGEDLVVSSARESDAEALFALVGDVGSNEDDEENERRYHAIEELFAATGRLASDPDDSVRQDEVAEWVFEVEGPAPVGMDEVFWLRVVNHARSLTQLLEKEADEQALDAIADEAATLHELLRSIV